MTNKQLTFSEERQDVSQRIDNLNSKRTPISILLDNVQDLKNIGSIFRTADGLRIEHLYIYGFQSEWNQRKLKKYSRSTFSYVPHSLLNTPAELAEISAKYHVVALEKTSNSIEYTKLKIATPLLLVVGNESHGVSPTMLKRANQTVHIPMLGINTSLNVSNATAIALYHIFNTI